MKLLHENCYKHFKTIEKSKTMINTGMLTHIQDMYNLYFDTNNFLKNRPFI